MPEIYAWLKYDLLANTRVSASATAPHSYIVEGEGGWLIRQNNHNIIAVPFDDEIMQHEGNGLTSAASDDGAVFTH